MNKYLVLAALVTALVVVAACAPATPAPAPAAPTAAPQAAAPTAAAQAPAASGGTKTIVYVTPLISMSPDWNRSHQAFMDASKEFGFNGKVVGPNAINVDEMVADIETAIASKADGIITCPLVPASFEPVEAKAKAAGIPVVNVMADCCKDSRVAFIGTDSVALGKGYAEKLTAQMKGKASIGVIMTDDTTPNQKSELDEFKKGIAASPDMKITDIEYDHSDKAQALNESAAMLTAHPDINAIVCIEGACPGAVATTLTEKNLAGKVTVLAIDLQPDTITAIKNGVIWAAFTQSYYNLKGGGRTAAQVIVDYWSGKKPATDVIDSGSGFWTKDNVDQYGK